MAIESSLHHKSIQHGHAGLRRDELGGELGAAARNHLGGGDLERLKAVALRHDPVGAGGNMGETEFPVPVRGGDPLRLGEANGGAGGRLAVARQNPPHQGARRGGEFDNRVTAVPLGGHEARAAQQDDQRVVRFISPHDGMGLDPAEGLGRVENIDARLRGKCRQGAVAPLRGNIKRHGCGAETRRQQTQSPHVTTKTGDAG
jgi:hypothetical protein